MKKCSICGRRYDGYGNNAQPINAGRCCDPCDKLVIARRMRDMGFPDDAVEGILVSLDVATAELKRQREALKDA